jgi:uncharacterized protein (TIGR00255 family)
MIRSMTGFGAAERAVHAGRVQIEIRTVNHRHLNVNVRLPGALSAHEPDLREWLRLAFARGHVNCTVRFEPDGESASEALRIDEARVTAYLNAFRALRERFDIPGEPDLAMLARYNDIFERGPAEDEGPPADAAELRAAVDEASAQAVRMREDEGRRLAADLAERVGAIETALAAIGRRAPERLVAERDRLRAAVAELAGGIAVDEARLAQEVAHLAERLDINEEIVRFRSHAELFRELLSAPSSEPVGKRLGFLVQEMHREANTIGSKANDAMIAHQVVAVKEEVERLREQVENVE